MTLCASVAPTMTEFDQLDERRFQEAALLSELLVRVGYAVWQAAECEDTIANYVAMRLRSVRGVGEVKGREALAKARSRGFIAKSNKAVDAFYKAAIAAGAKDNISPRARLEYYPGYYAADVFDPDGYTFEVVHKS